MKIILASKSQVRKEILIANKIDCEVIHSNVDEDQAKDSLLEASIILLTIVFVYLVYFNY